MHRQHLDDLTRICATVGTRRGALAALLVAALLPLREGAEATRKKGKKKRKLRRGRARAPIVVPPASITPAPEACFPTTDCLAGPGVVSEGCDFSRSTVFSKLDARGAILSNANFTGAQLNEADLRGAHLEDACLVGANLLGATIDTSTHLDGAIFCRTLMPDGSHNDRDCGKGTSCCPTPPPICKVCLGNDCISTRGQICSIFGTPCCPGLACTASATPFITTCEAPCSDDQTCKNLFGPNAICIVAFGTCLFLPGSRCCDPR